MKPRHIIEYAAMRAVCAVFARLPYRLALVLAWCMAWFTHRVVGYRVKTARARIKAVLGTEVDDAKAKRIAWLAWRNFVFNLLDFVRLARTPVERLQVHWNGAHNFTLLEERAAAGKGSIVVSVHMGSWEMMPKFAHKHGLQLFTIGRPQKNPLTSEYIEKLRTGLGFDTLMRGSAAIKGILSRIKKGDVLAMLMDVRHQDIDVDFLGGRAWVSESAAVFARHCQTPIVPFVSNRVGWTKHESRLFDPIWPDATAEKAADVRRITQEIFTLFDARIRERPEHFFWFNKRWILDPFKPQPEQDAAPKTAATP